MCEHLATSSKYCTPLISNEVELTLLLQQCKPTIRICFFVHPQGLYGNIPRMSLMWCSKHGRSNPKTCHKCSLNKAPMRSYINFKATSSIVQNTVRICYGIAPRASLKHSQDVQPHCTTSKLKTAVSIACNTLRTFYFYSLHGSSKTSPGCIYGIGTQPFVK